jgi:hypothetical protein
MASSTQLRVDLDILRKKFANLQSFLVHDRFGSNPTRVKARSKYFTDDDTTALTTSPSRPIIGQSKDDCFASSNPQSREEILRLALTRKVEQLTKLNLQTSEHIAGRARVHRDNASRKEAFPDATNCKRTKKRDASQIPILCDENKNPNVLGVTIDTVTWPPRVGGNLKTNECSLKRESVNSIAP